jgi:threonine dehydrogenase-like Zn-dependent dehydrogenase
MRIRRTELVAPRRLELTQADIAPASGEALFEVAATGICGTDLAIYDGHYAVPLPITLGHEFAGTVVEVGQGVPGDLLGRRVVGEINITCLAAGGVTPCAACRRGLASHCTARTVLGIDRAHGAFASHALLPARCLHVLPGRIALEDAVFVEPLAAAFQTFELSPVSPGEVVVVLGAGRLGVLVCAVAAYLGARVVAVSRSEAKRARALAMGAEAAVAPDAALAAVRDRTEGLGADIVVEATGSPDGLAQALDLVRPRGTIAAKTTCGLPSRGLDLTRLVVGEVSLVGSRCGPFGRAIAALASGAVRVGDLIEGRFALDELAAAMAAARTRAKVLVRP